MDIKNFVKNNNRVHFQYYRQQHFYYRVRDTESGIAYVFPVPYEEIGDATLADEDKAMLFMRYIRKAIADKTLVELV
jgi:hypothetical protein